VVVNVWLKGVPTVAVRARGFAWVDGSVNARSLPSFGVAAGVTAVDAAVDDPALESAFGLALAVGLGEVVAVGLGVVVAEAVAVVGVVGSAAVADVPMPMTEPMAVAATTAPIAAARRTGGLVDWCMIPPWESDRGDAVLACPSQLTIRS